MLKYVRRLAFAVVALALTFVAWRRARTPTWPRGWSAFSMTGPTRLRRTAAALKSMMRFFAPKHAAQFAV